MGGGQHNVSKCVIVPVALSGHGAGSKTIAVNCYIVNNMLVICINIQSNKSEIRFSVCLSYKHCLITAPLNLARFFAECPGGYRGDAICPYEKAGKPVGQEKINHSQGSCPLSRAPGFCILAHPHSQSREHYEKLCARDNPKYKKSHVGTRCVT